MDYEFESCIMTNLFVSLREFFVFLRVTINSEVAKSEIAKKKENLPAAFAWNKSSSRRFPQIYSQIFAEASPLLSPFQNRLIIICFSTFSNLQIFKSSNLISLSLH